ncbi:unnamed protein product [Clonostachys rosea]|uniref:Uncharacterized protein n=1 Tax=Bionectria ochroleuca TaxID=29856 RepID=A0ABY6UL70_BIOOC|nr:unnamed protein product [Clonostachys rosea]
MDIHGYDIYCGLCGGPLHHHDWHPSTEVPKPDLSWLTENTFVIGDNPKSVAQSKIWISKSARMYVLGKLDCSLDNNQDPAMDGIADIANLMAYCHDEGRELPFCVPFHGSCHQLLCAYLRVRVTDMNKEAFHHSLKDLALPNATKGCLDIDYGQISICHGRQLWKIVDGTEYFMFDPLHVHELQECYRNMPRLQEPQSSHASLELSPGF